MGVNSLKILLVVLAWLVSGCGSDETKGEDIGGGQVPPFAGTIFIAPDLIKNSDPTSYVALTYKGQGLRTMLDRRVDKFIEYNAHLFIASFDDGVNLEIQVNPEFDFAIAMSEAQKYSTVVGQMPYTLRNGLVDVAIHDGDAPFSGKDRNIVIHTIQGNKYINEGILAETLMHETVHAVIDKVHERNPQWLQAQNQDIAFISSYAQEHPYREDLAESFIPYLAARFKTNRISAQLAQTINKTIANRMNYLDSLGVELYPMVASD